MKYAIYDKTTGRLDRILSCSDEIGAIVAEGQCAAGESFVEVEEHVKTSTHVIVTGAARPKVDDDG